MNITRTGFYPKTSGLPASQRRGGHQMAFDSSDMDRRLDRFMTKESIEMLREGLGNGGIAFMEDVIKAEPTAPVLTSALKSAISVFVGKKLIATSEEYREGNAEDYITRTHDEIPTPNAEEAIIGVNAPYSAFQEVKYHPGYFGSKLTTFGKKYIKIVADSMKKRIL